MDQVWTRWTVCLVEVQPDGLDDSMDLIVKLRMYEGGADQDGREGGARGREDSVISSGGAEEGGFRV